VAAEGWRWVVAEPEFDHEACAGMRRVFSKPVPLSKAERRRFHELQARYDALCDKYRDGDLWEDDAAKLGRIEAAIDALRKEEYKVRDIALAGAFVTMASDGSVRIKRGFVFSALVLSGEARHETSTTRGALSRHHCREWAHGTGA
jgi:ParB family chromosome partitioning protein